MSQKRLVHPYIYIAALSLACGGILTVALGCQREIEPEVHMLPSGFQGRVYIVFGQPDGAPPKYEGSTRVYEIPSNGILLTQFKPIYGVYPKGYPKYFYGEEKKRVAQLFRHDQSMDSSLEPGIYNFHDGAVGHDMDYESYVVSSGSNADEPSSLEFHVLDSIHNDRVQRGFYNDGPWPDSSKAR